MAADMSSSSTTTAVQAPANDQFVAEILDDGTVRLTTGSETSIVPFETACAVLIKSVSELPDGYQVTLEELAEATLLMRALMVKLPAEPENL